jgi:hypothetical protein
MFRNFVETNEKLISEKRIGKDMERIGCGLICGKDYHSNSLKEIRKTTKPLYICRSIKGTA